MKELVINYDFVTEEDMVNINGGALPILVAAGAVTAVGVVFYTAIQIGEYIGKAIYYFSHR